MPVRALRGNMTNSLTFETFDVAVTLFRAFIGRFGPPLLPSVLGVSFKGASEPFSSFFGWFGLHEVVVGVVLYRELPLLFCLRSILEALFTNSRKST